MAARKSFCLIIAVSMLNVFAGVVLAQNAASAAESEPGSIESLQVKFQVDPATTKSLYMGEVWVAPAQFTGAQAGRMFNVAARAVGLDSQGTPLDVEATWKSSDPTLVKVTPETGKQVKFFVLKAGQGTVMVSFGNLTRKLDVKATSQTGVMQVEIDQ